MCKGKQFKEEIVWINNQEKEGNQQYLIDCKVLIFMTFVIIQLELAFTIYYIFNHLYIYIIVSIVIVEGH